MQPDMAISDIFGQRFMIGLGPSSELRRLFEPLEINDPVYARQLIARLNVPTGYWLRAIHQVESNLSHRSMSEADCHQLVTNLVLTRKIIIFKLASCTLPGGSNNYKIESENGKTFEFSLPTEHLLGRQRQLKYFSSAKAAEAFIDALPACEQALEKVAKSLNIAATSSANKHNALKKSIAEGLVERKFFILEGSKTPATVPRTVLEDVIPVNSPGNRIPSLGPHVDDEATQTQEYKYKVKVNVKTRAGKFPIEGVHISLNDSEVGTTDSEGSITADSPRNDAELTITAKYANESEHLKEETFELKIVNVSAEGMSYELQQANNKISKVQDVLGTGTTALSGDSDFIDTYTYPAENLSMTETSDAYVRQLEVTVLLATLSLDVPFVSQTGAGETITTQVATPASAAVAHTFAGYQICMPTSVKMMMDYWDIKDADGNEISRNKLMQDCWDDSDYPTIAYPSPWQRWVVLSNMGTRSFSLFLQDLLANCSVDGLTLSSGPSSTSEVETIPSDYADSLLEELIQGKPIVKSTYATDGHVMCVRGAVVDHNGRVQWLVINDPYGNLASPDSIYGRLEISAPVGLRGDHEGDMNADGDVQAVRDILRFLGHYTGDIVGPIDEANENDATVQAIKAFQGGASPDGRIDPDGYTEGRLNNQLNTKDNPSYGSAENEKNATSGDDSDRGKHVYYNGETEATGTGATNRRYRLKKQVFTMMIAKDPALTNEEIAGRLTKGS